MEAIRTSSITHRCPYRDRCRYRPDHSRPVSDNDDARRTGANTRFMTGDSMRTARTIRHFALNQARGARLLDSRGGPQFRLRIVTRTRALGAARLRHPRGDQYGNSRHLSQQFAEEWTVADRHRRGAAYLAARQSGRRDRLIDVETSQLSRLPDGDTVDYPIDDFARYCLLEGIDQLGFLRKHEANIKRFEDQRPWKP